jgi:hypothetical protein
MMAKHSGRLSTSGKVSSANGHLETRYWLYEACAARWFELV